MNLDVARMKNNQPNLVRTTVFFYPLNAVAGVVKMGNIVPRVGIEPTYLAFWASELITTPSRLPDVTPLTNHANLSCLRGQYRLLQHSFCIIYPNDRMS